MTPGIPALRPAMDHQDQRSRALDGSTDAAVAGLDVAELMGHIEGSLRRPYVSVALWGRRRIAISIADQGCPFLNHAGAWAPFRSPDRARKKARTGTVTRKPPHVNGCA